jgi:hypothetical protein
MEMSNARQLPSVAAILFGLLVIQPVEVQAVELTGAWASQSDLCKLVFTKKGNQVVFTELSDLYGSGFIIDGIGSGEGRPIAQSNRRSRRATAWSWLPPARPAS